MEPFQIAPGLYVQRNEDGSVHVWVQDVGTVDHTLTADEFEAALAKLSAK